MTKAKIMTELGAVSENGHDIELNHDDSLVELRGLRGIRKYREMRDNDPVIGATLMAIDMLIRVTKWSWDGDAESVAKIQNIVDNMDHSMEEFVAEILSFLPYGFALFEIVGKRLDEGVLGLKRISPRPQWTIDNFEVTPQGDIKGAWQTSNTLKTGKVFIPEGKSLLFRTVSINNDPAGRSILRNAYKSYHYVTRIQEYEAIAIERELNGIPIGRIPAEYLDPNADENKKAFLASMKTVLRDVKRNRQGYILLPSDRYLDDDGRISNQPLVDFSLVASSGTRDIGTNEVIQRHQGDIARTVLADFLMLGGSGDRGSFAMSKSKSDMFVHAVGGYLDAIAEPINRKLVPMLWKINGWDLEKMPKLVPGSVVPVDLKELAVLIRSMTQSDIVLADDMDLENHLREAAGMPERKSPAPDEFRESHSEPDRPEGDLTVEGDDIGTKEEE